ncbi:PREDICTED: guanylate cyclase soluble subunit alpha-2-like, partial [Branchiostoma belcheri]|uniref:guanylate cyclase n=1 Tax=Branchiostoma belcheri TaxID=7741 RepID=A0A6P4Y7Q7_BRABE
CTEGPDDTLFLHYYSERAGLYPIVKGLVRMIAKEFFHVSVACDVVSEERELTSRQGQVVTFSIRHLSCDGGHPGDEKRLSSGTICPTTSSDPHDLPLSVDTLSDIFPFHVMLDRNLKVVQMGRSLRRLLRGNVTSTELKFQDIFEIIRPKVDSLFSAIVRHLNTIYVVRTAQGIISKEKNCAIQVIEGASSSGDVDLEESTLKLKGEMVFVPESDMLLFLCSPRVKDLSEFLRKGLYFSDTPLHDSSRDVLMVNYLRRRERDLLDKIEDVGNQLRKLQGSLSEDKRRTEELLHSILPSNVVQSLVSRSPVEAEAHPVVSILFSDIVIVQNLVSRSPVEAEAHPVVSILFSDIVNFTGICERVEPMDIVRMLNKLYTSFDVLSKLNELYKVETIGDAYMVAGGIPVQVDDHADRVLAMAMGMMDVSKTFRTPDGDEPIYIRVGIHSGPCMAGVVGTSMPRYCLFGNTVSLASKMESCSQPGRTNISDATKM